MEPTTRIGAGEVLVYMEGGAMWQRMTEGWKLCSIYRWLVSGDRLICRLLLPNSDAEAVIVTEAFTNDGKKPTAGSKEEEILVPRVRRSLTYGYNTLYWFYLSGIILQSTTAFFIRKYCTSFAVKDLYPKCSGILFPYLNDIWDLFLRFPKIWPASIVESMDLSRLYRDMVNEYWFCRPYFILSIIFFC
ncbi:hypothetical protein V6N13_017256 [Hibiscus sabdariffa]|uniref:Uncharacterized protein n=1 Tax=Hibiscus sabdariffa TaxID=183260 RepID=A0ABR2CYS4_9ROSI